MQTPSAAKAISVGAFIAGTLDLIYACVSWAFRDVGPQHVFQSVASGWLGADAFNGGWASAALGVTSHYGIMYVAAAVFYFASRRIPALVTRPWLCGALFGIAMYFFMTYVVVMLSNLPQKPSGFSLWPLVRNLLAHAFLVGVPIALAARKYGGRPALG